jgi:hypothetical protein
MFLKSLEGVFLEVTRGGSQEAAHLREWFTGCSQRVWFTGGSLWKGDGSLGSLEEWFLKGSGSEGSSLKGMLGRGVVHGHSLKGVVHCEFTVGDGLMTLGWFAKGRFSLAHDRIDSSRVGVVRLLFVGLTGSPGEGRG